MQKKFPQHHNEMTSPKSLVHSNGSVSHEPVLCMNHSLSCATTVSKSNVFWRGNAEREAYLSPTRTKKSLDRSVENNVGISTKIS